MSLCHQNGHKHSILILRFHGGRGILSLDVILVTHVDEAANLVLGKYRRGNKLRNGISPEVKWLGVEAAEQSGYHVQVQLETGCEGGNNVVAVHENLGPSIVLLVHLLLIVDG